MNKGRGIMKEKRRVYYTYILWCNDHTLYIGWTNDLVGRIRAHNSGKGAKYTRGRRPVQLAYWEKFPTKKMAMQRESWLKQWSRAEKLLLIDDALIKEKEWNNGKIDCNRRK